jgi:hypothetical protein
MGVIFMGVVLRLADLVAAAGAVRPIFPGAPGFRRIRLRETLGAQCSDFPRPIRCSPGALSILIGPHELDGMKANCAANNL